MSSMPFNLGIPVVDRLEPSDGSVVLRTRNRTAMNIEIDRIRKLLSKKDLIQICPIGMRPDWPVPTAMYFTEVCIRKNEADDWMHPLGLFSSAWPCVITGQT